MDSDLWLVTALLLVLLLLLLMALLSSLETAVLNARRSRLAQLGEGSRFRAAEEVIDEPERFQITSHLAKSFCESVVYATAGFIGLDLTFLGPRDSFPTSVPALLAHAWLGVLLGVLTGYVIVTLFGEALPKSLAARSPEALLVRGAGFIRVFTVVLSPLRWMAGKAGRFLARVTGADPALTARAAHSEEEIKALVEEGAEEGVLEEEEKEMIHSIFEFTDTIARQVMVPRIHIHCLSADATLDDAVREVMETGHSRLPIYEETLDNVAGIVHVKDLLPYLIRGEREASIRLAMREPFFVPEGKKIDELLQEFRTHKSQMAIVVDEYGGTSGLVTLEDVVEEIVGEIEDEYDVEEHPAAEIALAGEGVIVDARMTLEDVNEQLALDLPRGDYDTLGGFVFTLFGRPPEVGEEVTYDGQRFIAEAMDGLRLLKIRVIATPPESEETGEESPEARSVWNLSREGPRPEER